MPTRVRLAKLFSPVKIGTVELKNRIVMASMGSLTGKEGFLSETTKNYLVRRAKGGAALITTELTTVAPNSQTTLLDLGIWNDRFNPAWTELATAIHDAGAKLSIQLSHGGRLCKPSVICRQPVAPSAVTSPLTGETPRELTLSEIEELTERFGEAATRARDAGADMVEIQGAQGQLVHDFMSPLVNKRTDEYGNDLKGRIKFAVEIIKRVKEKTGSDFPVVFRMVGSDLVKGGLVLEDSKVMAPILVEAGADALSVTAGAGGEVVHFMIPPADAGTACSVDLAGAIKSVVQVPIITAQRIIDPVQAEDILKEGKADIICLGRALLADPDWPRKAAEGAFEDIRHCIGCCQGCVDTGRKYGRRTCLQNPEVVKEKEFEIGPVKKPRRVTVVGGGPAGMEAARVAASRGHQVSLYEKGSELGGQWILACKPPKKDDYREVIRYNRRELNKLNVRIHLNQAVTLALIEETKPDVVIVATGAVPISPGIPGVDNKNVVTAHDVLSGKASIGDKVVVVGGGMVGSETADYLVTHGKKVTIIEMLEKIAADVGPCRKYYLLQRLTQGGVEILTSARVKAITEGGIIVDKNGEDRNIGTFDTVVLALGTKPVRELAEQLEGKVEVYTIGDAAEPRKAIDAIAEGARIGREI